MSEFDPDRRKVLMASGAALTIGLAGCSGDGDSDNDSNGGDNGGDGGDPESQVDTYLNDNGANGYESTDSIEDMTGQDSVSIEVGAGDNGLAFSPVAVRVDSGTEITWEWVDVSAGGHNVAVQEGPTDFSSETYASTGETFSQTLEDAGAYRYQCDPHTSQGMHGAVIVE